MRTFFMTNQGKVRQHNEDCAGVFENEVGNILGIVADGMGGHRAGDVASSMAVKHFASVWKDTEEFTTPQQAEQWIKEQVTIANQQMYEYASNNMECQGMGTTLVVVICTHHFMTIGHVGDSRCYMLSGESFTQLTEDHSLVNELVRTGQISKEDAEVHPRKNVLMRALGTEERVALDMKTLAWEVDDTVLLCSDGLSNKVSMQQLNDTLRTDETIERKAETLVQLANDLGGEDNITLVLIEHVMPVQERG
ncbi:Stp1/IreP family PP2C-type Ser/Thr phosphatase [Priestia taiwanensis]|uniref:protein-serine/threonine phosphatase n=1 Tax=Priestia taiwanensis TaxID=1347902 RepID=A0A917APZ9_9BACI|nr:Stp1/IreP family PP2C-type Ser/Thr phosphatase [Priestia taiwanensis]MBM7362886.1 protein phosphatase [Priestia taiwanensis]GGE65914.1 protein phosphatase [Priestia taiwanensis]